MPTNYTGDPTATQAPSPAPGKDIEPVVVIPADGEAANVASITQEIKCLADFNAWLTNHAVFRDVNNSGATFVNGTQSIVFGFLGGTYGTDTALTYSSGNSVWSVFAANGNVSQFKVQAALQTTDATSTSAYTLAVPSNRTIQITTSYVGAKTDHASSNAYVSVQAFKNNAGTVTEIGTKSALVTQQDDAGWGDGTWTISGTNVLFKLVGKAATTINWMVTIDATEVG